MCISQRMVRKSGITRRSSKRGSQIPALKHLSLLDPAPPEPPLLQSGPEESPACLDRVYLHAAAIFQNTHLEKPAAHRLISYGKRSEVRLPVAKDEASQRSAYQLAFNTLKCKCELCFLDSNEEKLLNLATSKSVHCFFLQKSVCHKCTAKNDCFLLQICEKSSGGGRFLLRRLPLLGVPRDGQYLLALCRFSRIFNLLVLQRTTALMSAPYIAVEERVH